MAPRSIYNQRVAIIPTLEAHIRDLQHEVAMLRRALAAATPAPALVTTTPTGVVCGKCSHWAGGKRMVVCHATKGDVR